MVVRMRHTRSQRGNTRSHHVLQKSGLTRDSSGNPHLRHRASLKTGMYRGRKVIDLEAKLLKKTKKAKEEGR
jgi:ribosomal protein L32